MSSILDLFSLKGKVALVTGGGSGIGVHMARGFVQAGARTYISSRKMQALEATAAELSKIGECIPIQADLSTEAGCKHLASEFSKKEEKLHILMNNSGNNWGAPFESYPDAAFDRCWALNVKAVFHTTRELLPLLEKAATDEDPARVINIGSIDGIKASTFDTYAYATTKAAVHHLTRALSRKFAPKRITVNLIAPGPFESKMTHETFEKHYDLVLGGIPLGRMGRPDDLAGTAVFLASRAGAYLTGAIIPVDGGATTDHV